jgi:SAM-dependent methyltransferase
MQRRAPATRLALCRRTASTAKRSRKTPRVSRPTERFSSRVEHYVRYRPSYPSAAIDLLKTHCGLSSAAVVADIGSGTGILTELLLESGAQVIGVEPNDEMRVAAEARLGAQARFRSVNGTAEATTLPPASIDLLVAGQAFHWFDVDRARHEALRLLRSAGFAALLWNERPAEATAFLDDYAALLLRHCAEYAQITASRADEASMRRFFGGAMDLATFPNQQSFDFEGLKGRLMSSSYAPEPGDPQHQPMMAGLRELFARHQHRGRVVFPYRTLVYFGQPQRPGR